MNRLNIQAPAYRKQQEEGAANRDITMNLNVFNGMKALCVIYIIYGNTFLYSWYSILADSVSVS